MPLVILILPIKIPHNLYCLSDLYFLEQFRSRRNTIMIIVLLLDGYVSLSTHPHALSPELRLPATIINDYVRQLPYLRTV